MAEIVKTTVTPQGDVTIVELQVSSGGDTISLSMRLGVYELPLLVQLEIAAISEAILVLRNAREERERAIASVAPDTPLQPRPARRT